MRRQRLVKAAEPQNQRGLTRFQLSQMLEEKTKAFKDVRARLRLVLERKPRILPPVKPPRRRKTLWDFLLDEMRLIATDYNEERKLARHLLRGVANRTRLARRELCEGRPQARDGRVADAGVAICRHLSLLASSPPRPATAFAAAEKP
ncbi:unnamed protein product, partial [Ectocarpus sp. 12 AP-2014]